jgi:hypothetical protein
VQRGPAHQLHLVMELAERASRGLADYRERLGQEVVERLTVAEPLPESIGELAQLGVGEIDVILFERLDVIGDRGQPPDLFLFSGAQKLGKNHAGHGTEHGSHVTFRSHVAPSGTRPRLRAVQSGVTVAPRPRRRAALVLGLVITAFAVPFGGAFDVAQACGCGAFDPARGGTASVPAETALVSAAAGYEDIYLSLTLNADVRSGALLFPVPDRHPVVSAGPRDLFAHLTALTSPAGAHTDGNGDDGNGAGAPAPSVVVERRQAIGPLDVVTLAVDSSGTHRADAGTVLTTWLTRNGFKAKPDLAPAAAAYIERGWAFVAVRLRPATSGGTLDGQLDPLHLRFRTSAVVYPMRLSHLARTREAVTVYTLAAHAFTLHTRDPGMRLSWAGRLSRAPYPELEPLMGGGARVLTRYDGTLDPATIDDDFHFVADPRDRALATAPNGRHFGTEQDAPSTDTSDHTAAIAAVAVLGAVLLAVVVVCTVVIARRRNSQARF